jgi:hypothetical protein
VYAENVAEVSALGSANSASKKSARSNLKRAALEKFKTSALASSELTEMAKLMKKIAKAF